MKLWKKLFDFEFGGKNKVMNKGELDFVSGAQLKIAGTSVTSSAAELNIMDGVTATATELNSVADASARIVTTTATALSLTVTEHGDRVVLINTNSTVANTFTLPVAAGTGAKFTLINGVQQTQGTIVVAANGTLDVLKGVARVVSSTEEAAISFLTTATSDKYSFNLTTTGGLGGDVVECWDVAANTWQVQVNAIGSGGLATGFAAT